MTASFCGCASVRDNPLPPYPVLEEPLHTFLQAPREGRFTLPPERFLVGSGYGSHVLIVSNQTAWIQPWPDRVVNANWEIQYPPSCYRAQILTQDQIQKLSTCATRDEVVALLGTPNEEAPDFLPLLPPLGGKPLGINSRSTQNLYYQWFSVTESDHVIETSVHVTACRSNGVWRVRNLAWNMEGYGTSK
jgi:hypothetical protein